MKSEPKLIILNSYFINGHFTKYGTSMDDLAIHLLKMDLVLNDLKKTVVAKNYVSTLDRMFTKDEIPKFEYLNDKYEKISIIPYDNAEFALIKGRILCGLENVNLQHHISHYYFNPEISQLQAYDISIKKYSNYLISLEHNQFNSFVELYNSCDSLLLFTISQHNLIVVIGVYSFLSLSIYFHENDSYKVFISKCLVNAKKEKIFYKKYLNKFSTIISKIIINQKFIIISSSIFSIIGFNFLSKFNFFLLLKNNSSAILIKIKAFFIWMRVWK